MVKGIEIEYCLSTSRVVSTIVVIEGKKWFCFTIASGYRTGELDNEDTESLVKIIPWLDPIYLLRFSLYQLVIIRHFILILHIYVYIYIVITILKNVFIFIFILMRRI